MQVACPLPIPVGVAKQAAPDTWIVVVKPSYELDTGSRATLARDHDPLSIERLDAAGAPLYPSDYGPAKLACDVVLVGELLASPPRRAALRVGRLRKQVASLRELGPVAPDGDGSIAPRDQRLVQPELPLELAYESDELMLSGSIAGPLPRATLLDPGAWAPPVRMHLELDGVLLDPLRRRLWLTLRGVLTGSAELLERATLLLDPHGAEHESPLEAARSWPRYAAQALREARAPHAVRAPLPTALLDERPKGSMTMPPPATSEVALPFAGASSVPQGPGHTAPMAALPFGMPRVPSFLEEPSSVSSGLPFVDAAPRPSDPPARRPLMALGGTPLAYPPTPFANHSPSAAPPRATAHEPEGAIDATDDVELVEGFDADDLDAPTGTALPDDLEALEDSLATIPPSPHDTIPPSPHDTIPPGASELPPPESSDALTVPPPPAVGHQGTVLLPALGESHGFPPEPDYPRTVPPPPALADARTLPPPPSTTLAAPLVPSFPQTAALPSLSTLTLPAIDEHGHFLVPDATPFVQAASAARPSQLDAQSAPGGRAHEAPSASRRGSTEPPPPLATPAAAPFVPAAARPPAVPPPVVSAPPPIAVPRAVELPTFAREQLSSTNAQLARGAHAEAPSAPRAPELRIQGKTLHELGLIRAELWASPAQRRRILRAHGLSELRWRVVERAWSEQLERLVESPDQIGALLGELRAAQRAAAELHVEPATPQGALPAEAASAS